MTPSPSPVTQPQVMAMNMPMHKTAPAPISQPMLSTGRVPPPFYKTAPGHLGMPSLVEELQHIAWEDNQFTQGSKVVGSEVLGRTLTIQGGGTSGFINSERDKDGRMPFQLNQSQLKGFGLI
eukprot:GHVR01076577.1.p1 GENE.GHVR01076577.1~~GHVR01076577.1.p1  ORF type:complete len:122 (+),score=32.64 GHVR01076577.1:69-434(+)